MLFNIKTISTSRERKRYRVSHLSGYSDFIKSCSYDTYGHPLSVRYESIFSARRKLSDVLNACNVNCYSQHIVDNSGQGRVL